MLTRKTLISALAFLDSVLEEWIPELVWKRDKVEAVIDENGLVLGLEVYYKLLAPGVREGLCVVLEKGKAFTFRLWDGSYEY